MTARNSPLVASRAAVRDLTVEAFTIPTDEPESDGTHAWQSTTIVVVHATAGDAVGLGFSYTDLSAASIVERVLAPVVRGHDVMNVERCYVDMVHAVRNIGLQGVAASAIAAVDIALWDAKARLLDVPLVSLPGAAREAVPIYGSGGFTSYTVERLQRQLAAWAEQGLRAVKMKIGRDASADLQRVQAARRAIGDRAELFVDANGAYDRKQALAQAGRFAEYGVSWFEEPVSSDDLDGLRLMRDRAPAGIEIAAGEYGYDLHYFKRMADSGAVDVLQADATRCCGVTGFLRAAALCDAACLPMSAHTAPSVHVHPCCAASRIRHLEYFHDHVRIEQMLFDGVVAPVDGALRPDLSRPGLGLELRRQDAARYAV